ncbi:phosphonate C-P lyase system protein PhnG [Alkalimarinus alittae]|uniref:Phosphonate C-P lyase system protein PhnG n=1 Tax=Alkalimarinus alittae TaxID=2961619 RepID=A0ABY6N2K5_9ALTE|nr:phosphonate C-P lyase system protein PhnG [Alkalimarinus alittae]UZE96242.1 phosphonate C-P lyase system protein PhnG [Alkalimarinus alittae]
MTLDVKKQAADTQKVDKTPRQQWMSVLSKAPVDELERRWKAMEHPPKTRFIRTPEIGLMMVRGRAGGSGTPFNLGEMTMTRCVVELENGTSGFGYVKGRSKRHAELAASFDALLQDTNEHDLSQHVELVDGWLKPLHKAWQAARDKRSKAAASTKVDFFTMVRGE